MYEAFKIAGTSNYERQLIGINPTTGAATCYPIATGIGAPNNEVSGISTTANGALIVFFTGGNMYKANFAADGTYTGALTLMGASGIPALGVTGSIRGDLASCGFGSLSLPQTVNPGSGALPALGSIIVYPNPSRGITTIALGTPVTNGTVRVLNMTGNILSEKNGVSGSTFTVDMSGKPSGLYIVEILQGGSIQKAKVFKQ